MWIDVSVYDFTYAMRKLLKNKKIKIQHSFSSLVATWFYIGALPLAQGTLASLSTYPIYLFCIRSSLSGKELSLSFALIALVLFVLGLKCASRYMRTHMVGDHCSIVIDEVVGQLIAFSVANDFFYKLSIKFFSSNKIVNYETGAFLIGFILFRYFDIRKPLIIRWFERNLKGALGVMVDDIAAGLAAGGFAYIIYQIMNFSFNGF
ncbi:Phosphatidylglycerophosphatase A [Candidatus Cyrtobacter comes]|uniref:Phosphatidylglycerophosphatase A n=1 Tax=Candidatus Cyrtobacter comes TaxID=675776 RepID=A0ABU5L7L1_9RICK|nr:phosphatidylglycerophosphatase A [Candidatus Cyrtobacter comes]MDZ5762113.1 Phosphatidylglycerophosphatase A [Candidatus Cyrtobacter comes]